MKFLKEGLLIVVSGPSGVGKGTVCKAFLEKYKDVFLSVSATTRKARVGEVHGENYYFLEKEVFLEKASQNGFLEYAEYVGNYYGTPKAEVLEKIMQGQDVLLEIELQGAMQVKKAYPKALFIFLLPPSMEILKNRIIGRGTETDEVIEERMKKAEIELDYIENYDYVVVNKDVVVATELIWDIIKTEKHRVERNQEIVTAIRRPK